MIFPNTATGARHPPILGYVDENIYMVDQLPYVQLVKKMMQYFNSHSQTVQSKFGVMFCHEEVRKCAASLVCINLEPTWYDSSRHTPATPPTSQITSPFTIGAS
jgi:hypothetical protein